MPRINLQTGAVTTPVVSNILWSQLQKNIFTCIEKTTDNIAIKARAGSGKTTTLIECMNRLPSNTGKTLFAAFSKSIVDELVNKLPVTIDCKTLHALGYNICKLNHNKYVRIDKWKTLKIIKAALDMNDPVQKEYFFAERRTITEVVSNLKQNMFTLEDVTDEVLKALYIAAAPWSEYTRFTAGILHNVVGKAFLPVEGERCFNIDFDDMLYLPVINSWIKPVYDCIFLDEAQDLNAIQHTMINQLLKSDGRLILAGDPQQSVYGFRGAITHGMLALTNAYVCTELPLSISYRCKPAIVKEANIFVTDIESADHLEGGVVKIISLSALIDKADNESMVLCRTNAPLVSVCLSLIAAGKPATVIGNDVHQHVLSFVKRMGKAYRTTTAKTLEAYTTLCINMSQTPWQKQKIEDIKEILLAIIESDMYTGEQDLETLVEEVFAEQRNCIRLSTIHKMKGKEADKVFLLHPDKVPIKYAESPDELEQEYNLLYVAITRAKSELYYVTDNKKWGWRE